MKHNLSALLAGVLFGFGLAYSGMTDTHKVLGFLDIFGDWDYDLAFVMAGALAVSVFSFRLMRDREYSFIECPINLPKKQIIDRKLLIGSAVFGIGWGLFGYCPGPALTSLIYFDPNTIIFVISMVVGIAAHRFLQSAKPVS